MPRNVRNFWLTLLVDGRATPIAAGPRGAAGGFRLTIQQRNAGEVTTAGCLRGHYVGADGALLLTWDPVDNPCPEGHLMELARTKR